MTVAASVVQGILLTFALVVILMPPFVLVLRRLGFGKRIRIEGPGSHLLKEGTPTMGGVLVIVVVAASAMLFHFVGPRPFFDPSTIAPILTLLLVGALGTWDDYLNAKTGDGIRIRQKLLWQVVVAGVIAFQIQQTYAISSLRVPFVGEVAIEPILYVLFAAFAIVATTNGVNFTDGLDGLAGGTLIFAFVAYMIIAMLNVPAQPNLAILCALLIGALLGFLWFNVHPAQIFMGDSGALALGATLAVMALITGEILLLPLIGIVFVVEVGSGLIQIGAFKLTGRRIFRMAPLHHHFELAGWDEEKITLRFWIIGVLAAMLGVVFFMTTIGPLA
ncbi:MAG: phospho-N-acetylmuramoyl-pentapeptide-transferase [Chloroflexota bacterium]|nr:phospho-N-acetylmuramoyl-pentapeptide-transferase [Chloroflexota bacterium]